MPALRVLRAMDLVGALQGVVDGAHHRGHAVGRIEALVRIHLAAQVGVARHLPAAQVDRLEPGLHLLHRLIAGERAERGHVRLRVQQMPQPLRAHARQRVLNPDGAAQAFDVLRAVGPHDPSPTRIGFPGPQKVFSVIQHTFLLLIFPAGKRAWHRGPAHL